jgi:precorrin-6A/cobalt-precorrin-6A reductase
MTRRVLILGGTTEARELASALADRPDVSVTLSLAGRTASPMAQPVPVRRGGFGGVEGLTTYLNAASIDLVVDATHPYAQIISANAREATARASKPLLVLRRPAWEAIGGDRWIPVADASDAMRALPQEPANVFLALGRNDLQPFVQAPQHHYLIRSVDRVAPPLPVPHARYLQARGPFDERQEYELLASNGIEWIVAKNSGGAATYGKIVAARLLGVPVLMIKRPPEPAVTCVGSVEGAVVWLNHALTEVDERGV